MREKITLNINNRKSRIALILILVLIMQTFMPIFTEISNVIAVSDYEIGKIVTFNDIEWYIIEDNSINGYVTLLATDASFGICNYSDIDSAETNASNKYKDSVIEKELRALTDSGSFKNVAYAIRTITVNDTDAKLYLLNSDEANKLPSNIRSCTFGTDWKGKFWWLRPTTSSKFAPFMDDSTIRENAGNIAYMFGLRPALQLDLDKVIFNTSTNTFTIDNTAKVATSDEFTTAISNPNVSKIILMDDIESGYTDGSIAVSPYLQTVTRNLTITSDTGERILKGYSFLAYGNSAILNFENIIIDGNRGREKGKINDVALEDYLIQAANGATLNFKSGAIVQNFNSYAQGVIRGSYNTSIGSTINIEEGSKFTNLGARFSVFRLNHESAMNMSGGIIEDCVGFQRPDWVLCKR